MMASLKRLKPSKNNMVRVLLLISRFNITEILADSFGVLSTSPPPFFFLMNIFITLLYSISAHFLIQIVEPEIPSPEAPETSNKVEEICTIHHRKCDILCSFYQISVLFLQLGAIFLPINSTSKLTSQTTPRPLDETPSDAVISPPTGAVDTPDSESPGMSYLPGEGGTLFWWNKVHNFGQLPFSVFFWIFTITVSWLCVYFNFLTPKQPPSPAI